MSTNNTTTIDACLQNAMNEKLTLHQEEAEEEAEAENELIYQFQKFNFDNDPIEDDEKIPGIKFINYRDESQLEFVMKLVGKDLSEPYSIFTYRYFLHRFPQLCIFAIPDESNDKNYKNMEPVGCVVCKIDIEEYSNDFHKSPQLQQNQQQLCGYMAMLAVDTSYRRLGIGLALVKRVLRRMKKMGCTSVTLETECSNKAAIKLYEEQLGFLREEYLARYYLNFGDAYRLKLYFSD